MSDASCQFCKAAPVFVNRHIIPQCVSTPMQQSYKTLSYVLCSHHNVTRASESATNARAKNHLHCRRISWSSRYKIASWSSCILCHIQRPRWNKQSAIDIPGKTRHLRNHSRFFQINDSVARTDASDPQKGVTVVPPKTTTSYVLLRTLWLMMIWFFDDVIIDLCDYLVVWLCCVNFSHVIRWQWLYIMWFYVSQLLIDV